MQTFAYIKHTRIRLLYYSSLYTLFCLIMLRKRGYTPQQLRDAYDEDSQKPYGEVDFIKRYGKPPYEFLGEAGERNYPNYSDFVAQYVDDEGREYQRTESEDHMFVRIPIRLTRRPNDATYEDYVGFPAVGDVLNLSGVADTGVAEELHVRVQDVPYEKRRAVSNIYVELVSRTTFVPDLIDSKGRMYMRCSRNDADCVFAAPQSSAASQQIGAPLGGAGGSAVLQHEHPHQCLDEQIYYVRLPPACICDPSTSVLGPVSAQTVATVYANATEPYHRSVSNQRRMNGHTLTQIASELADYFLDGRDGNGSGLKPQFPARGERFLAYHLYGERCYEFRVSSSTELVSATNANISKHSDKSSCFVILRLRHVHHTPLRPTIAAAVVGGAAAPPVSASPRTSVPSFSLHQTPPRPQPHQSHAFPSARDLANNVYRQPTKYRRAGTTTVDSAHVPIHAPAPAPAPAPASTTGQTFGQRYANQATPMQENGNVPQFHFNKSMSTSASFSEVDDTEMREQTRRVASKYIKGGLAAPP